MAGRKDKWINVKNHIDNGDIKNWTQTMTERQMAKLCGVCMASWCNYKVNHKELLDAIVGGREDLAKELKSDLIKKARGGIVKTKKTYIKIDDVTGKKTKVIEETETEIMPDTGAIHLLLKNYDEDWRNDDYSTLVIKQEESKNKKQENINKYLFKDKK